ncbi:MAG: hypothetical protein ACEQSC_00925 [Candidatus Nanopelagicaceae bacterium]
MHNKLTTEQQFEIAKIRSTIESASADQLREILLHTYETMFAKDNIVKELLANQWGIELADKT